LAKGSFLVQKNGQKKALRTVAILSISIPLAACSAMT
jgi:hypothetical protein